MVISGRSSCCPVDLEVILELGDEFRSQKTPSARPCILRSRSASSNLFSASKQYSVFRSMPRYLLPSFFATTEVAPEPRNGSSTISPGFELAKITLARSFSGFCVGWSVFSGMDQKGTVRSVQMFDGWVRRKSPSLTKPGPSPEENPK